ncbi:Cytochrome P450 superfamily protein [Perilla frutescens var. frutescens]|nr:Cytochrome P450 superfamily protein [Perilla frutescens var. frutescens]
MSLLYTSLSLFFIILILKLITRKNYRYRLPPSPAPALPLIGHLHLLKPPLHRTFSRFSRTHGPIFSLKLGVRRVVVVSSPNLVKECFTENDIIFSNRPRVLADKGLKKKLADLGKKLDDFYERLLAEHRREKRNTIIGHLLSLQETEPEFYTDPTIKGFITNILLAGTDTSAVTIEWAMSLLLNHPNVLQNAKLELDSKIKHQRLVGEQDLPNLNYLHNIVLETFRMFPAGPLLMPRESSTDCRVGGYDIPRGTILLINVWAIHRDPNVWDEPMRFKPERFQGLEADTEKLMPFGIGRRACPGSGLGHRIVELVLASLIQCFEWKSVGSIEVDLAEGVGLTMPKLKPLEAMCRPRQIMSHLI